MIKYKNFENRSIVDDVDITKLANEYGTPLYVISYSKLKSTIEEFKTSFTNKYENVNVHYASKANLSIGLAQIMQKNGFGLDVVSMGELFIAINAGVDLKNVEFNGNNKTYDEVLYGIENGVGYFVVDNEYELNLVQEIASKLNKVQKILFRLTPNVSGGAHKHINTGQKDSKFGIPLDKFEKIFEIAMLYSNIDILGIHFHVGSQLHHNNAHLEAIMVCIDLLGVLKIKYNYEAKVLNIGGGFGIDYLDSDHAPNLNYYFEPIMNLINKSFINLGYDRPKIIIEPGRYMIGEAGFTLYKVGMIKEIEGVRKYIGVDGGMSDNIRPSMYQAKYKAIVANNIENSSKEVVTIAGNCCESGDIIIENIELPVIKSGDIICVFSTGAYSYSMASNYNKHLIPATVLIEKGKVQTLIKKQSLEQLIENDLNLQL